MDRENRAGLSILTLRLGLILDRTSLRADGGMNATVDCTVQRGMRRLFPISRQGSWSAAAILLAITGLGLAIRLVVLHITPLVGTDAHYYLLQAGYYESGQWGTALLSGYHPLYPLLVGRLGRAAGSLERAGQYLSLLAGTLTIPVFYFLARRTFSLQAARWTALLLALLPFHVRLSADVLTEPTYILLFALTVLWILKACSGFSLPSACTIGLSGSLAYLTRPEGAGLLAIGLVLPWVPWGALARPPIVRRAFFSLLVGISFLLAASPFLVFLREAKGSWQWTSKGHALSIPASRESESPSTDAASADARNLAVTIPRKISAILYLPFLPLLLVGFLFPSESARERPLRWLLLAVSAAYLLVLIRIAASLGYLSARHLAASTLLLLPWAGGGACGLVDATTRGLARLGFPPGAKDLIFGRTIANVLLCLVVAGTTLPKLLRAKRTDQIANQEAGLWLRSRFRTVPRRVLGLEKVAYYADAQHVAIPCDPRELVATVARSRPEYVALYEESLRLENPAVAALLEGGARKGFLKEVWRKQEMGHHPTKRTLAVYFFRNPDAWLDWARQQLTEGVSAGK